MLDSLFRPRSIAVIGASGTPRSIGWQIAHNIIAGGFNGRLYPVNPKLDNVHSIKCHASVLEIPDPVDLAVVAVRADQVLDVARECAQKGVGGMVVISAGFKEVGGEGLAREQELLAICGAAGIRLIGPNCMGILNTEPGVSMNATFARTRPIPGGVAFMSQSGALGEAILNYAGRLGLGLSMFASVGNIADVSADALLEYWDTDPRTELMLLYLESFGDPRRFVQLAREITKRKPVIAVKAGATEVGRAAIASHTGSLAAGDAVTEALFAQCGVLRVRTVDEMFDLARAFATQPLPKGRRVAVVTNAGGPGILATDACIGVGLEIPALRAETLDRLRGRLHPQAALRNPVDLIASAQARDYAIALEAVLADPGIDAVLVIFVPPIITDTTTVIQAICEARRLAPDTPVLACLMGEERDIEGVHHFEESRIPVYPFPEPAAYALAAMVRQRKWRDRPLAAFERREVERERAAQVIAGAQREGRRALRLVECFELLEIYGIPTVPTAEVRTAGEALSAAERIGWPVALKIASEVHTHKTDVGGVVLDLEGPEALATELERLRERLLPEDADLRFLVQPMLRGGLELILGMTVEPKLGPVVMFGLGGIHVETLRDVAFRIAPFAEDDARAMIAELRARDLLRGVRGKGPVDIARLTELIVRLAQLVTDHPTLRELDVNPLLAFPGTDRFAAVDARAVVG
ncbi:MAG: hypothetical protein AMXMBFR64_58060 [Myxococcales bacterium]